MLKIVRKENDYEVYENDRLVGVGRDYDAALAIVRLMSGGEKLLPDDFSLGRA